MFYAMLAVPIRELEHAKRIQNHVSNISKRHEKQNTDSSYFVDVKETV